VLSTEKLSKAFLAIVEEAEKALEKDPSKKVEKRLKTIVSIAKHQSDIRDAKKGGCCSTHKKCK
jgi:hypothetical protein